jgi:hypothetical protein
MLAISPANAGGVSIKIGLGSITADLTAWGVGSGATANFSATGIPYVWCIAPGNTNIVPGQNPSQVSAEDAASLDASGKGKFSAFLSAEPNFSGLTGTDFGCPNNNWKATPFFVEWQTITVTITNPKGEWFTQTYTCTTTYIPDYTPNDGNTFNDGTITCQ